MNLRSSRSLLSAAAGLSARIAALALALALAAPVFAGSVIWGSSRFAENKTSSGQPLGADFRFQLGAFPAGFDPAVEPQSTWLANWIPVQVSAYSGAFHFFTGEYVVPNPTEIPAGTRAYIWGFNARTVCEAGGSTQGEWVLITDGGWRFPGGGFNDLPLVWSVAEASTAVAGQINLPEAHIKSAAVTLPDAPLTPQQWKDGFLAGVPDGGWGDDPDADGRSTLEELAHDTNPLIPDRAAPIVTISRAVGSRSLRFDLAKNPCVGGLSYFVEVSENLKAWRIDPGKVIVETDSASRFTARVPVFHGRLMARLGVALPPG